MPLGRNFISMLPAIEPAVAEAVRQISTAEITRREPHHHPEFRIRVIAEAEAFYDALAEDMLQRILAAAAEGRRFVGIFPVGPTGQYPRLAEKINRRRVSLAHVHLFFLDEYAYANGRTIEKTSPWSFERIAQERLIEPIERPLRPAAVHFPGPENIARYDELIGEASDGRGADVLYGGIGWTGHFAFWEPQLAEEFPDFEAWQRAPSAHVWLHPMTILQNSLRAGGDWTAVPPCAYTIGPQVLLAARYRSFWLDADLGRGISWQRFIGRLVTHGPVTPHVPASIVQTLPGEVVFLQAIAEEIGDLK